MKIRKTEPYALLAVAGAAGVGKDTFADILVAEHGFTKIAFADPMRAMAAAMNPIVESEVVGWDMVHTRYNDAVAELGYVQAKIAYPEIRRFLQTLGTEAGRQVLGDDIWVDTAMASIATCPRVVIADLRFRNEAKAVRSRAGLTVKVQRHGVGAVHDHISEHDLDSWTFADVVTNDGSIEDLRRAAWSLVQARFPWILRGK